MLRIELKVVHLLGDFIHEILYAEKSIFRFSEHCFSTSHIHTHKQTASQQHYIRFESAQKILFISCFSLLLFFRVKSYRREIVLLCEEIKKTE